MPGPNPVAPFSKYRVNPSSQGSARGSQGPISERLADIKVDEVTLQFSLCQVLSFTHHEVIIHLVLNICHPSCSKSQSDPSYSYLLQHPSFRKVKLWSVTVYFYNSKILPWSKILNSTSNFLKFSSSKMCCLKACFGISHSKKCKSVCFKSTFSFNTTPDAVQILVELWSLGFWVKDCMRVWDCVWVLSVMLSVPHFCRCLRGPRHSVSV